MKITHRQLRRLIKEEISRINETAGDGKVDASDANVLRKLADDIDIPGGTWVLEGGMTLEALVKDEFQAWQEEQKANLNKFQPGLGAGGNEGKAATQRSVVFDKVQRALIQDYGFMDDVAAYRLKNTGEQYDEEKVIAVGKPIYREIYDILYVLIPRPH